ncbi:hypothetical protein DVU_2480 [Nitratidesulfovibrio vulgaris str. Hildenborough]|uniref:Uncharacterized protein n=1 Tax=Nitratidesulfovibrio vulgaris (strain ATCC 29579 / DSM 644 / CCUG 34227 / NCIMB 8303 / VKM B-1760 / Hildenborough) TaxID=882 RepID=Q728X2_NITV2|nr:hypothetical protein DVU_2480 [Nitratidesulfovibrio vulgaris str. Hildenborough]
MARGPTSRRKDGPSTVVHHTLTNRLSDHGKAGRLKPWEQIPFHTRNPGR